MVWRERHRGSAFWHSIKGRQTGIWCRLVNGPDAPLLELSLLLPSSTSPTELRQTQWRTALAECQFRGKRHFFFFNGSTKKGPATYKHICPNQHTTQNWSFPGLMTLPFPLARSPAAGTQPLGWFQYMATVSTTTLTQGHCRTALFPGSLCSMWNSGVFNLNTRGSDRIYVLFSGGLGLWTWPGPHL